ncbi:MAG: hypothetical protein RLZZ400_299 [Actinomycetota bacterium]
MSNSRSVALDLLNRVFNDGAYANLLIGSLSTAANLDARDASLVQELGFGTIRQKQLLDAIIQRASGRSLSEIDATTLPILELGAYQLLFTRIPNHAAINETVDLAKQSTRPKSSGFVNAVLRKVINHDLNTWVEICSAGKTPAEVLSLKYSHPDWIVQALKLALASDSKSEQLDALLAANNEPAEVNLVALPGRATDEDTQDLPRLEVSPHGFALSAGDPGKLNGVRSGRLRVQDAGSQLVAMALAEAKPIVKGEQWLDMCAGPGGKAALLAAFAERSGAVLVANEVSPHRAKLVSESLSDSGFEVKVSVQDGRTLHGSYDRILIDAPCTGLGALRRRPEARWRKSPSDLTELVSLQKELLEHAWTLLKPGGVLVYATCSPHPAETLGVIEPFIRTKGDNVTLVNCNELLNRVVPKLQLPEARRTTQLWTQVHGTDAMFLSVLEKPLT